MCVVIGEKLATILKHFNLLCIMRNPGETVTDTSNIRLTHCLKAQLLRVWTKTKTQLFTAEWLSAALQLTHTLQRLPEEDP